MSLRGVDLDLITAFRRELSRILAKRTDQTRWVLIRVPNEAFAQQAGMSTEEMMEFFFNATLLDWKQESQRYEKVCAFMQTT